MRVSQRERTVNDHRFPRRCPSAAAQARHLRAHHALCSALRHRLLCRHLGACRFHSSLRKPRPCDLDTHRTHWRRPQPDRRVHGHSQRWRFRHASVCIDTSGSVDTTSRDHSRRNNNVDRRAGRHRKPRWSAHRCRSSRHTRFRRSAAAARLRPVAPKGVDWSPHAWTEGPDHVAV